MKQIYHLLENPDDNSHKPPTDIFEYTFLILFSVISSQAQQLQVVSLELILHLHLTRV